MTEIEELAEALIPEFNKWINTLERPHQGYSVVKITDWAHNLLKEHNSYVVIDGVIEIMIARIMPERVREDGKLAHIWLVGKDLGFTPESKLYNQLMCRDCGNLKGPPQYPETACKGRIKITLR